MPENFDFGGEFVWQPTPEYVAAARVRQFMQANGLASYDELMARSTSDIAWFTNSVLHFLDIRFARPYTQVVDLSRGLAWPRWCIGAELNIVTNCLDKYQDDPSWPPSRLSCGSPRKAQPAASAMPSSIGRPTSAPTCCARWDWQGRHHRPVYADDARNCGGVSGHRAHRRHHLALVLGLWCGCGGHPPGRRPGQGHDHSGWVSAPRVRWCRSSRRRTKPAEKCRACGI